MLAAETVFEALKTGDARRKHWRQFPQKIEQSWIKKELWAVRNFHQGFHNGLYAGLFHAGIQFVTGGRGLVDPMRTRPGHEEYRETERRRPRASQRFKGDGALTFDRLTDVYHSGTRHEEDQPCHLARRQHECLRDEVRDRVRKSLPVFLSRSGLRNGAGKRAAQTENQRLQLRALQNLRHRRPYEIITWVPPEGGGGPNYEGM